MGCWGGIGGEGVNKRAIDTRCSARSRGMQGPDGSEGAAGGFTAGARSGMGDDGSGGRRRGWRRETGGVGDAKGGSSSTPFTVLREREGLVRKGGGR